MLKAKRKSNYNITETGKYEKQKYQRNKDRKK